MGGEELFGSGELLPPPPPPNLPQRMAMMEIGKCEWGHQHRAAKRGHI